MATAASEDTAARILEAGIACFAERGFDGASTRALAAAAGVNVATLAYHFKGKEGLYEAAVDRIYARLRALVPGLTFPEGADARARVDAIVRLAWRFLRAHRTEVRLLLRHVLEHGRLPGRVHDRWLADLLDQAGWAWALLGLPPDPAWRLHLLTLNHLLARYAISDDADLRPFAPDADPADPSALDAAVEDHLAGAACRLLGV